MLKRHDPRVPCSSADLSGERKAVIIQFSKFEEWPKSKNVQDSGRQAMGYWDEGIELASNSSSTVQAVTVGAGPTGEKFSELGDAMVGALVPNPCHDSSCNPSAGWIDSLPSLCCTGLEKRGEGRRGEFYRAGR